MPLMEAVASARRRIASEPTNVHAAYELLAATAPEALATVSAPRVGSCHVATYAEVGQRSRAIAKGLHRELDGDQKPCRIAIHVPRTHPDFLPVLLAMSRCNVPFVLMSVGLSNQDMEKQRNRFIVEKLEITKLIHDGVVPLDDDLSSHVQAFGLGVVSISDLLSDRQYDSSTLHQCCASEEDVFALMFTGGTKRTKVVKVTHGMILHERLNYPKILHWTCKEHPRVLVNAPTYWPAATIGQFSLTLALGGCAIISDAVDAIDVKKVLLEQSVNVFGAVPDILALLAREPAIELPDVRIVIAWAERLPRATAERWRDHPKALLLELLISTEYWLTFYADPLGVEGSVARALEPDVEVCVLQEDGTRANVGGIGELFLRGPMVTPGYLDEFNNEDAFCSIEGKRYFRTRDTVRVVDGGFVFHGRVDMLTKEKGQWVDMGALEQELQDNSRVSEACIIPHPIRPNEFHAFVVLHDVDEPSRTVQTIRKSLPWRTSLHLLKVLPRHSATGKVDITALQKRWLPQEHEKAWPILCRPSVESAPIALKLRFQKQVRCHAIWTIVALSCIGLSWNLKGFLALLTRADRSKLPGRWRSMPLGPLVFAYAWLSTLYFTHVGSTASNVMHSFPFGRFGMLLILHLLRTFHAGAQHCLSALALVGAILAFKGKRFFSWPLIFWFGIGQQLHMESGRWLKATTWTREVTLQLDRLEVVLDEFQNYFQSVLQRIHSVFDLRRRRHFKQIREKYKPNRRDVATQWEQYPQNEQAAVAQARQLAAYLGTIEVEDSSWWSTPSTWQSTTKSSAGRARPWWTVADSLQSWPEEDLEKSSCSTWVGGDWHSHARIDNDSNDSMTTETASTLPTLDCCSNTEGERYATIDMSDGANTDSTCSSMAGDGVNRNEQNLSTIEESPSSVDAGRTYESVRTDNDGKTEYDYYYNWPAEYGAEYGKTSAISTREVEDGAFVGDAKGEQYYYTWNRNDWTTANKSNDLAMSCQDCRSSAGVVNNSSRCSDSTDASTWEMKQWWWYNCTSSEIEFSSQAVSWASQPAKAYDNTLTPRTISRDLAPQARRLLELIHRTQPHLTDIGLDSALMGMDSLRVSILANAISAEFGVAISSMDIMEAKAVRQMLERIEEAPVLSAVLSERQRLRSDAEFAVWFTPGQFRPMGPWVMRCDKHVDSDAMAMAVAQLIERHSALRAFPIDPQAFRSFILNAAVMFTLLGSFLPSRMRRLLSVALCAAWPRVRVRSSLALDQNEVPLKNLPFDTIDIEDGQSDFENQLSARRWDFEKRPSFDVALFKLKVPVVGVWDLQDGTTLSIFHHNGKLIYADLALKQTGCLTTPQDADWPNPPNGFPALYASILNDGSIVWLRWEHAYDLRLCQKTRLAPSEPWTYRTASRSPQRDDGYEVVTYLVIQSFHAFADGFCFAPLAGDLLDLYHAQAHEEEVGKLQLPLLGESFEVLQRRLFDTLHFRLESTDRHSLRGSLWNFQGRGYSHNVGFEGGVVSALKIAASRYGLPMNYLFLSLVIVAYARASAQEIVDMTLYVPMRDGYETGLVGLFADWRDITVVTSKEETVVLAVVLQVADILRLRRWRVFNALRKAECVVVNFDSLDPRTRNGFAQLPRSLWDGGLTLGQKVTRGDQLDWLHQPLVFDIQEESNQWWLYMRMAYHLYPPPWTRRFLRSIEDAAWDIVFHPSELVHKPFKNAF